MAKTCSAVIDLKAITLTEGGMIKTSITRERKKRKKRQALGDIGAMLS